MGKSDPFEGLIGDLQRSGMKFGHFFWNWYLFVFQKAKIIQVVAGKLKTVFDLILKTLWYWGGAILEPGMMYFPTKGGAKEPQNPQNHGVADYKL